MERAWPVAITAIGSASAATVAWRHGPQLFVTAIVKGTFAIVPSGTMSPTPPEPIFAEEQEGVPGLGLYAPDDLAPHLGETDVSLTGHAPAPRSPATRTVKVRLAILRDGTAVLDKELELEVPRGGAPRPIPITGMGPISKQWPIRRRLLGAVDPRCLAGPILEIPTSFDWRYFQASSSDLRVGPLRGNEWLVLGGAHPTLGRLITQLPGARGVARLYGRAPGQEGLHPLALTLDALRIDVDRGRCSLTWRGRFAVSGELSSLQIVAGIELPERPILWPDPPRAAAPAPAPRPAIDAPADDDPLAGTIVMAEQTAAAVDAGAEEDPLAGTIVMANKAPARAVSATSDDPLAGTLGLFEETAAALAARPATPFQPGPSSLAVASKPFQAAPVAAEDEDPLGGTLGLDELPAAALVARPVIPFAQGQKPPLPASPAAPPTAPEDDPLLGTLGLDEGTATALAARPATPFRPGLSSPLARASTSFAAPPHAATEDDPLGSTLGLDENNAVELAARAVGPFRREVTQPPAILSVDLHPGDKEEEMPRALGAQFLAAMAAINRQQASAKGPHSA
jgi:hypothetical protein